jgi:hypothetical protein
VLRRARQEEQRQVPERPHSAEEHGRRQRGEPPAQPRLGVAPPAELLGQRTGHEQPDHRHGHPAHLGDEPAGRGPVGGRTTDERRDDDPEHARRGAQDQGGGEPARRGRPRPDPGAGPSASGEPEPECHERRPGRPDDEEEAREPGPDVRTGERRGEQQAPADEQGQPAEEQQVGACACRVHAPHGRRTDRAAPAGSPPDRGGGGPTPQAVAGASARARPCAAARCRTSIRRPTSTPPPATSIASAAATHAAANDTPVARRPNPTGPRQPPA